ncbi:MAG TPA: imidazole glycerol phosphate synthase subunit HisH [Candidatus Corynebacterium avicola]|uniref:Imidazole glycerol phosphate synthase subunit HisH n=1 Tax=Candidatus Corynebacterium avicola TaxID=2838527 RepID=A0A9D1UKI8_9CORY|nr:imidazole glycerol phosphate synthase subunit HisH [Candidatus Corynebacterium avicola]
MVETTAPTVALLDYGSGNLRSAQRALEHVGAEVTVTSDPKTVLEADGLLVPGVGNFSACMEGLKAVNGPRMIGERLSGGRPVFGICVGMQILFDYGAEGTGVAGCGEWPGSITRLSASVLPHMGWNTVEVPEDSTLFAGADPDERYYFVHSYGARTWDLETDGHTTAPSVTWAQHEDCRFVAAVENGPLWATQFHPEKSGAAGARLLRNWLDTL